MQVLLLFVEDTFNKKLSIFYNDFHYYPVAKKFIDEKLIYNRKKTVAFFTKHIFTADYTSIQCLELLNRFLKGFGSMKREITT